MQYVFIEEMYIQCTMGSGAIKAPEAGGFYKVTSNCKLQQIGAAGRITCSPNSFVGGAT